MLYTVWQGRRMRRRALMALAGRVGAGRGVSGPPNGTSGSRDGWRGGIDDVADGAAVCR